MEPYRDGERAQKEAETTARGGMAGGQERRTPGRPIMGQGAGEGFPAGDPVLRAKTGRGRQCSLAHDREQLSPPHLPPGLWEEKDGG